MKQLGIDGSQYKLSEGQVRTWIELYGSIDGALQEEAIIDGLDGTLIGTGAYLATVRLDRRMPSLIPMHGLKISIDYSGITKMCKNCYKYHKREISCQKQKWSEYVTEFKLDNPGIVTRMMDTSLKAIDDTNTLLYKTKSCCGALVECNSNSEDNWIEDSVEDGLDERMEES
jgi:hypothetical protein